MNKIIFCALFLSWHTLLAQQAKVPLRSSQYPGAPAGVVGMKRPPVSRLRNLIVPKRISATSYSAVFYTFNDIGVFSYSDSTHITVMTSPHATIIGTTPTDTTVLDTVLNADSFESLSPGNGFYLIIGNKPFAALAGDAITSFASGYYALDQYGNAVSTKLDTWMMRAPSDYDPHFVLFSYGGQAQFTMKDLSTGGLLYEGVMDSTGYFDFPNPALIEGKAIQVSSDRPVSALCYSDQGYYVPSSNGTLSGNLFYGFSGYITGNENSITVTSYADDNAVVITDLTKGDTILVDTLNHWQVKTIGVFNDLFWKVESTGTLTAADIPFAGWGIGTNNYYNLTQCADSTGKGIGTAFVLPTIAGDMEIFSYADNNEVRVFDLGDTAYPYKAPVQVEDTILSTGGVCVLGTPAGNNVFRVESSAGVSVVQSFGGAGGAGFVPVNTPSSILPDLTVSPSDISFISADSIVQAGQNITVSIVVHNYGAVAASNVRVVAYDGNPDLGFASVLSSQNISSISAGGAATMSFQMVVPPGARYHLIFVKIDPNDLIPESNKSNNQDYKYLTPNNYIHSFYSVYFSAPGSLKLQSDSLTPNPFSVNADIFNTSSAAITNPNLNIEVSVSNGMKILSGPVQTTIPSFPSGGRLSFTWSLQANKDSSGFGLFELTLMRQYLDTNVVTIGILVPDTIAPPVPWGLAAQTDSSGPHKMKFTWSPDSARDIAGYKIYYSMDSTNLLAGTGALEGHSPIYTSNVDTFIVSGLTNDADYWFALSSFDYSMNESGLSQPAKFLIVTKVRQYSGTPKTYALLQNFPNPFNPSTTISYQLPVDGFVTLKIYDILGREVRTVVNEREDAGIHSVAFNAAELPSAVYFYVISAGEFRAVKKLMVLK